jgi:hypothetical protein
MYANRTVLPDSGPNSLNTVVSCTNVNPRGTANPLRKTSSAGRPVCSRICCNASSANSVRILKKPPNISTRR